MLLKTGLNLIALASLLLAVAWNWHAQRTTFAPELSFTTITGQTLQLSELQGKPVLISFWATDCASCIEEIPQLIALHQQYAKSGLTIIAVAMYYDPPNHVLTLATDRQIPYAIALDPEQRLARAFDNVQLTPTTFLLNRDGSIAWKHLGRFDVTALQQQIEANLQAL